MNTLQVLRIEFDAAATRAGLSPHTIKRYKSWIRRYLSFCRKNGLKLSADSTGAFLKDYTNRWLLLYTELIGDIGRMFPLTEILLGDSTSYVNSVEVSQGL